MIGTVAVVAKIANATGFDKKLDQAIDQTFSRCKDEEDDDQEDEDEDGENEIVNPWEVKGKVNYMKLIQQFGTSPIATGLIQRWERVTKTKAHVFLRRGIVFSHQDLENILNDVEACKPVYLYTGRGPSSESMHLGHLVPFMFTKYLQNALNCIVIIQMSDDEKFFFKGDGNKSSDLNHYRKLAYKNAEDIIACGFDVNKTFIFSNLEHMGGMLYFNNVLGMKSTTLNQVRGTFGLGETQDPTIVRIVKMALDKYPMTIDEKNSAIKFVKTYEDKTESSNVGQIVWPIFQGAPAYCTSFQDLFVRAIKAKLTNGNPSEKTTKALKKILGDFNKGIGSITCLVPMSIDQSPYFRGARDIAHNMNCPKPVVIHGEFLPPLESINGKMNSTTTDVKVKSTTLFLDIPPEKVVKMIKSHAYSGGGETLELHRQNGGNIKVDIPYQYLTFFLESDEELKDVAERYSNGTLTSGEIKDMASKLISDVIKNHQERKKDITFEIVQQFFNPNRDFDIGGVDDIENVINVINVIKNDYKTGIDFDRTFGCKQVRNMSQKN